MLNDLMVQFKKATNENERFLLDNYRLKNGLYIKINKEKAFSRQVEDIQKNQLLVYREKTGSQVLDGSSEQVDYFKKHDYISHLLLDISNKAIDSSKKTIHSTNVFTFFIKEEKFDLEQTALSTIIDRHYDNLQSETLQKVMNKLFAKIPKETRKEAIEQTKKRYEDVFHYLEQEERNVDEYRDYIKDNLQSIVSYIKEIKSHVESSFNVKGLNYIKIFFEEDEESYYKESMLYYLPKIFSTNDYNVFSKEEIKGFPSFNTTMNEDKPYQELKTMTTKAPIRLTYEEAMNRKDMKMFLESKGKNKNVILNYSLSKEKEKIGDVEIPSMYHVRSDDKMVVEEFDNVPFAVQNHIRFKFRNVLEVRDAEGHYIEDRTLFTKTELEQELDTYFFKNCLRNSYEREKIGSKAIPFSKRLECIFSENKQILFDYFHKGINVSIRKVVDKHLLDVIQEHLTEKQERVPFRKMALAYNLRLSFLAYLGVEKGGTIMKELTNIQEDVITLLQGEGTKTISKAEFFYLAGQVSYYLMNCSNSKEKKFHLVESVLKARTVKQLKREITLLFEKYKHEVSIHHKSFKEAMSLIMLFQGETKIKNDEKEFLLAGLMSNNVFYISTKQEEK